MINEALLEMYYLEAIKNSLESAFGARFFRLFKPSQNLESWVGFDQGWISATMTEEQFFKKLRNAVRSDSKYIPNFYVGYFMQ